MKYTIRTTKYIFKNFFYILPFAVLPAFLLSLSLAGESIEKVLTATFTGKLSEWTFFDLFCAISVLNFGDWGSAVAGLLSIIAIFPCVALFMAFLEKHMRIGKRTFNGLLSKLNDNIPSTFGYGLLFLAIYEIWSLITAALLYCVSLISNLIAAYILLGIVFLAMHVLLLYTIGLIYLWLPCMQITGFPMLQALEYSHQLLTPVKWKILAGQLLALLGADALICVCVLFVPSGIFTLITTILYVFLLLYYCVRMEIAYFDRDHIERADLRKYY